MMSPLCSGGARPGEEPRGGEIDWSDWSDTMALETLMTSVYSMYQAKAKLSEIVRKAMRGQRVRISYRGREVAEVGPILARKESTQERLARMEAEGTVVPALGGDRAFEPVAHRPGALRRFLEQRE
jgi:prevent-host-death family protein